ncbi:MAG: hypothetical protein Q8J76_09785, partial [Desulfobulbaceae bacterium]|nr:hypothetical protein [Desulfobulbaceae bacterium]
FLRDCQLFSVKHPDRDEHRPVVNAMSPSAPLRTIIAGLLLKCLVMAWRPIPTNRTTTNNNKIWKK